VEPTEPAYLEWPGSPLFACTWAARFDAEGRAHVSRIIPDGCIDLLWSGSRLTIVGPDTEAHELPRIPNARFVGLRFRPAVAPAFLGVPASALVDQHIDASELLDVNRLVDALSMTRSARAAATVLQEHVTRIQLTGPDALVIRAIHDVRAEHPRVPQVELGDRQLRRRFAAAVGYAPKTFQRILRLRRFVALASPLRSASSLAALAFEAGYADQAHLTREIRALTGLTPRTLVGYPITAA
jgi:AraC-like DNA-binding protein